MLIAKCVKECRFKTNICCINNDGERYTTIHPFYSSMEYALKTNDGDFLCWNGKILSVFDKVCLHCGGTLEDYAINKIDKFIILKCKECSKTIKMHEG